MVRRFWFLVVLQLGLVSSAIVLIAALGSIGVPRGVSIALGALLTIPVVFVVVHRMKQREDRRLAAMPSAEAKRYESRRIRFGFAAALVGTAFFAAAAVTFQTPQAILMFALYLVFFLSVARRLLAERRDGIPE